MSDPSTLSRARWTAHFLIAAPVQGRLPFRSPAAIERAQRRRLRRTVEHACHHVPYYREAMGRLGLAPKDFGSARDLARLPLIGRRDLQVDPGRFASDAAPLDSYIRVQSGGSTGEPITYYRDAGAMLQRALHNRRALPVTARALRTLRPRVASIGPPGTSASLSEDRFRRSMLTPVRRRKEIRLSMFEGPAELVPQLNSFRPDIIFGFGSVLEELFIHIDRTGVDFHRPKLVTYSAEPLSEEVRRLIAERLRIPVFGNYRAVEAVPLGFECEAHRGLHLNIDLFPVRIVNEAGEDVETGASGEVVISNLVNRGTVLLNYRLGDVARLLPESCPCGRTLPLLSLIEGRTGDWLVSPSGRRINSQALQFELYQEPIWRYQVVQESPGRFRVALVEKPESDRYRIRERIERKLKGLFGEGTTVQVSFVETLPRTSGGKVRPVVPMPTDPSEA